MKDGPSTPEEAVPPPEEQQAAADAKPNEDKVVGGYLTHEEIKGLIDPNEKSDSPTELNKDFTSYYLKTLKDQPGIDPKTIIDLWQKETAKNPNQKITYYGADGNIADLSNFDPQTTVIRWLVEENPGGLITKKGWRGEQTARDTIKSLAGYDRRKGWRNQTVNYTDLIKRADPHSKLGKFYRGEQKKGQLVPGAIKDIKATSTPLASTTTKK